MRCQTGEGRETKISLKSTRNLTQPRPRSLYLYFNLVKAARVSFLAFYEGVIGQRRFSTHLCNSPNALRESLDINELP